MNIFYAGSINAMANTARLRILAMLCNRQHTISSILELSGLAPAEVVAEFHYLVQLDWIRIGASDNGCKFWYVREDIKIVLECLDGFFASHQKPLRLTN